MDDWDLIQTYSRGAGEASEKAFAEIVRRHVNIVYSAARRSLVGNRSLAEDVTQRTFALLAARATRFDERVALVSWLYKTACNLSQEALRGDNRRRTRELEAMQMQTTILNGRAADSSDSKWDEVAPHLEEAMLALPEKERALILLRFFERKPFSAVAEALHITEEAARMRGSRALQKLRGFFARRGITISSIAIGNLLLESAASAAPAVLVASLAVPLKLATTAVPLTYATKWILMTTAQKAAVVATALVLAVGIGMATAFYNSENGTSAWTAEQVLGSAGSNALELSKSRAASSWAADLAAAKARLDRAIANLRSALTEEWPDRRMPTASLRRAIEDFGTNREAAVPILLEYLNGPRVARSLTAMSGAAYCLELLGTDAVSALPDLFILLRSGDLAIWNDFIPRVFTVLSPDGAIIPELLDSLTSAPPGGSQIVATLTKLFEMNPALVETHRARISSLLDNSRYSLSAALLLAAPGIKDPAAIPVLTNALRVARLGHAVGYDFTDESGSRLVYQEHEAFQDNLGRLAAVQALGEMGSAATNALPALIEFAKSAPTNSPFHLRELALAAIGKIDPEAREKSPEIETATHAQERSALIIDKARTGTASFEELTEGLELRNAADSAAEALLNHPEARAAIPQLIAAVDQFESPSAVDLLKKLDHAILIDRIKAGNTRALNEVARTLGEVGPDAKDVLPQLIELLNATRPEDADRGRPYALDEAIHKIDSAQPKLLYKHEDLADARVALLEAIYGQNKIRSSLYDGLIQDFQDINAVSRGHLLRFVETTKADPDLHKIFVDALLRNNPELAGGITEQLSRSR